MSQTLRDSTMVKVNLYATLRGYCGGAKSVEIDVQPKQTVAQLLEHLGIPSEQTKIIFANNRHCRLTDTLQDGDQLDVFPPIAGG